jgi:outer membrane protein TolC
MGKQLLLIANQAREDVKGAEDKVRDLLDEDSEEVNQTDLFKLELFKYEVKKRQREAILKYETAYTGLRILLDIADEVVFDLAAEEIEEVNFGRDSIDVYYGVALNHRPEVAQLNAGIQARKALLTVANSNFWPQFYVAGQIKYNYARGVFDPNNPFVYNPTNFFRPGIVVGLNWNLNFAQNRDRSRLAYVEYRQMEQRETLLLNSIKLEVQTAYMQLEQAEVNLRDSNIALRAGRNWLRSETMKWDIGAGEVKDLIDAYKASATMETEHLQNVFKYNVAVAKLGKAIGRDLIE